MLISQQQKQKKEKEKEGRAADPGRGRVGEIHCEKKVRQLMWIMRYKSTIISFGAHRGAYGHRATRPEDPIYQ